MKFEIDNGHFVGTAEWKAPGQVAVDVDDPQEKQWFEDYFAAEDCFMSGPVECAEMKMERRDESEQAFTRAAMQLAAYSYAVRQGDGRRHALRAGGPFPHSSTGA